MRALQVWIKAAGLKDGPLFRPIDRYGHVRPKRLNGFGVAVILKRSVQAAGFDPDEYSGHSLRAGLATAAAGMGAPTYAIRKQTGQKRDRILEIYIREGSLFRDNVAGMSAAWATLTLDRRTVAPDLPRSHPPAPAPRASPRTSEQAPA